MSGWIVGRIFGEQGKKSWSGGLKYFNRHRKGAALAYARAVKGELFRILDGHLVEVAACADVRWRNMPAPRTATGYRLVSRYTAREIPRWRWHKSLYAPSVVRLSRGGQRS